MPVIKSSHDKKKDTDELRDFLNIKAEQFNSADFIEHDPIAIPHQFSKKEDIEIAGFLVATIAWGNRKSILNNGIKLMKLMGDDPHHFVMNYSKKELKALGSFVHRTFNGEDVVFFMQALRHIYQKHNGLESAFTSGMQGEDASHAISNFKKIFFEIEHPSRTTKHISDPISGSSAKRLNMYLRWMCRKDNKGVDFGIWDTIPMSKLSIPLDVHTGNISRKLGLLTRTQNDWKAVQELNTSLRYYDPVDPVKYDFALFGLGAIEGF
jgi:uncharacterized protein (TIGR02757 family)